MAHLAFCEGFGKWRRKNHRHRSRDRREAAGAAKPMESILGAAACMNSPEMGMRTKKVAMRLWTSGKTGCPPPLKKAFIQKTKETKTQSML